MPLKNVFEAANARQKQAKNAVYVHENFEFVFNTSAAMQIVFRQRDSARDFSHSQPQSIQLDLIPQVYWY